MLIRTLSIILLLNLIGVPALLAQPAVPTPISPGEGSSVIIPTFTWLPAGGAAYYELEVGPQGNPTVVYWSDKTYLLTLTPNDASDMPNEPLYWRVRAYDSTNGPGSWSNRIHFTKYIPDPPLTNPSDGSAIVFPTMEWQPSEGAAYYQVELSTVPTFMPVDHTYTTYNTGLTPNDAIAHGTFWWRVSGVDADGHEGTASAGWTFDKDIPSPTLIRPTHGSTVDLPTLEWQTSTGAAYYKVELSTDPDFVPLVDTYETVNTRLTPVDAIAADTYYWRVSGVDAGGSEGTAAVGRSFTLTVPSAPVDPSPSLLGPGDGETLATDPTFRWTRVVGATHYRLVVSTDPGFGSTHDWVSTDYPAYTPYTPGSQDTYANGTYYWKVEARKETGTVITTSEARSFRIGFYLYLPIVVRNWAGQ